MSEVFADWAVDAPCAQADPDAFFPDGNGNEIRGQVRAAQAVCASCDVRVLCARRALEGGELFGVWAGVYIGFRPGDRRVSYERLRGIAAGGAVEVPAKNPPKVRKVRKVRTPRVVEPREAAVCTGTCGRMVRPTGASEVEFPGTMPQPSGRGMCRGCYKRSRVRVSDELRQVLSAAMRRATA